MSKITATRIDNDDQRLPALPAHFGADFLRVEMAMKAREEASRTLPAEWEDDDPVAMGWISTLSD